MQATWFERAGRRLLWLGLACVLASGCAALDDEATGAGEAITLTLEESESTLVAGTSSGEATNDQSEPEAAQQEAAQREEAAVDDEPLNEPDDEVVQGPTPVEPATIVYGHEAPLERTFSHVVDVPLSDTLNLRSGVGVTETVVAELQPGQAVLLSGETATLPTGTVWLEVVDAASLAPRGWAHGGFLDPVTQAVLSRPNGRPAAALPPQAPTPGGNGSIAAPQPIAAGCNAVQVRIDAAVGPGAGGSGDGRLLLGTEAPSGTWDGTLANTTWSAGPGSAVYPIEAGSWLLATLPVGATYYVMPLGPGNAEPVLDPATNQPLVNGQGRIDSAAHHTIVAAAAGGC